jgi:hypothetical protein
MRDVVEEDRPVRDATHKIETVIAAMGQEVGLRRWCHLKEALPNLKKYQNESGLESRPSGGTLRIAFL